MALSLDCKALQRRKQLNRSTSKRWSEWFNEAAFVLSPLYGWVQVSGGNPLFAAKREAHLVRRFNEIVPHRTQTKMWASTATVKLITEPRRNKKKPEQLFLPLNKHAAAFETSCWCQQRVHRGHLILAKVTLSFVTLWSCCIKTVASSLQSVHVAGLKLREWAKLNEKDENEWVELKCPEKEIWMNNNVDLTHIRSSALILSFLFLMFLWLVHQFHNCQFLPDHVLLKLECHRHTQPQSRPHRALRTNTKSFCILWQNHSRNGLWFLSSLSWSFFCSGLFFKRTLPELRIMDR